MTDDRFDEEAHDVPPEVRRQITNSQPPIRPAIEHVRRSDRGQWLGVVRGPGAVLGEDRRRVVIGMKIEQVQIIAVIYHVARIELDGAAHGRQRPSMSP